MSFLAVLGLSAACLAPQEEAPSLEEELAALIETTNQLETFHLVFDVHGEGEGEGESFKMEIELVYRAPDLGRVRFSGPAGDLDQWIVGDRVYLLGEGRWKRAAMPEAPHARRVLDEHFPRTDGSLEPGVAFGLVLERCADGRGNFGLTCIPRRGSRDWLLGWLKNLQRWPGVVTEGEELRWENDGMRCVVDRRSGLLKEVTYTSEQGQLRVVQREGRADEPLASGLVTLPAEAHDAPESPELASSFGQSLASLRRDAFAGVDWQLTQGKREWSALTRRDWEVVVDALHREQMIASNAKTVAELRKGLPERAEQARRERGEEDSPEREAWNRKVAEARAQLVTFLEQAETRYRESIPALELRDEPRQELLDVEAEVLAELWGELVRHPMLELFDESFAEAASK